MSLALTLHLLAATLWIGGMFFAYVILRPCAAKLLPPPQRLMLWHDCFKQFFPWVWGCVITLLTTGYGMVLVLHNGFGSSGWQIKAMGLSGFTMIILFTYLYMHPYQQFKHQTAEGNYPEAGQSLATMRRIIGINLVIGLLTITIAIAGKSS